MTLAVTTNKSLELEILGLFSPNPFRLLTINQVARLLGKRYPNIHRKVTSMIKSGILKATTIGRAVLCTANLEDDKAIMLLSLLTAIKNEKDKEVSAMKEKLMKNSEFPIDDIRFIFICDKEVYIVPSATSHAEEIAKDARKSSVRIISVKEAASLFSRDKKLFSEKSVIFGYESYFRLLEENKEELMPIYSEIFERMK